MRKSQTSGPSFWALSILAFALASHFLLTPRQAIAAPEMGKALSRHSFPTAPLQGFALVELFTSQGCSSCPGADWLLADINRVAQKGGLQIYPLSFHVDYWNNLGWVDPFSQSAFTNRQRMYQSHFSWGIFTPQVVINGQKQWVGSPSEGILDGVSTALNTRSKTPVDLKATWSADRKQVDVQYDIQPNWTGPIDLHIILAEPERRTEVKGGENKGQTLSNVNVVRHMETRHLSSKGAGNVSLPLPKDWESQGLYIVAIVQDQQSLLIVGANQLLFD